jgi:hypothetical protein
MLTSVEGNAVQAFCTRKRMLLTELETSARTESKRITNHNTPQLSRTGMPVHCATFHGLSRLNTRAVQLSLALANIVILGSESRGARNHILQSEIRHFLFRRLPPLTGSRWRYSTPPPHRLNWIAPIVFFNSLARTT